MKLKEATDARKPRTKSETLMFKTRTIEQKIEAKSKTQKLKIKDQD